MAAGESSRMGRDKALLPWPPVEGGVASKDSFLSAAIRSLADATDFVVVVAGENEAALAPIVYANGATLATNPDPSRGQFSSLQVGLHEVLNHGRDAAMITLVDRAAGQWGNGAEGARGFRASSGQRVGRRAGVFRKAWASVCGWTGDDRTISARACDRQRARRRAPVSIPHSIRHGRRSLRGNEHQYSGGIRGPGREIFLAASSIWHFSTRGSNLDRDAILKAWGHPDAPRFDQRGEGSRKGRSSAPPERRLRSG